MYDPAPYPGQDPAAARAERRLAVLEEMTEIGMRLMRRAPIEMDVEAAAEAYAKLSRAVRLNLALEEKTDRFLAELSAGLAHKRDEAPAVDYDAQARANRETANIERKARAFDLVLAVSESESESLKDFEDLFDAMVERLDGYDAAADGQAEAPVSEAIERLCRDIGLSPELTAKVGEGWLAGYLRLRPAFNPFSRTRSIPWIKDSPPPGGSAAIPPAPA
jgi:hypothetical protein